MLTNLRNKLLPVLKTDWVIGFLLLGVFFLTNGYKYAWDDQHLEIPLLKKLIDPTLYVGDYYVESLKTNYLSFFYPLLAKVISLGQIPAAYFLLYLLSRYFLFYWIYKLWLFISQRREIAFCAVVTFILIIRVPEFLYRTFSHQEFALGLIAAGIYFFYRERFMLAAAILGVAANIHALYSLFPMLYMLAYLLIYHREKRLKNFFKAGFVFFFSALPFLIWAVRKYLGSAHPPPELFANWYDLYTITCSQNFVFLDVPFPLILKSWKVFFLATQRYWFIFSLLCLNFVHNETFRRDKKCRAVILSSFILLFVTFYFNYIHPNRFILDLNLVRNMQYVLLFLAGYTTLLFFHKIQKVQAWLAILMGLMFIFLNFGDMIGTLAAFAMLFGLSLSNCLTRERTAKNLTYIIVFALLVAAALFFIGWTMLVSKYKWITFSKYLLCLGLLVIAGLLGRVKKLQNSTALRNSFIIIPLILMLAYYCHFHLRQLRIMREGAGFWQLQRSWEDMQKYVKDHTPKDALLLVPYDMEMGGFRIQSNRKVLVCYRDCGIIGFDYKAAVEWQKRIADIEAFKVLWTHPIKEALVNALLKYKVDYIVFPAYYAPKDKNQSLTKEYSNELFILFKVVR